MDTAASFWNPGEHSTMAGNVDSLFYFILWASVVFFAIVVGGIIYFGIRYRRRGKDELTTGMDHNLALEITWTVIPTILIVIVFLWGFKDFLRLHIMPAHAMEVKVTGQKWFWTTDYPDGTALVNEMVVPVNTPVRVLLSATDVIHSFYIPSFRVKMDALPNRYTLAWFEATNVGTYDWFCAEFCGKGHSEMIAKVRVLTPADFAKWQETASAMGEGVAPEVYGAQLYKQKACITCHSIDGTIIQGPSFKGIFGHEVQFTDGSKTTIDENYIRESILNPRAKIVNGFQPVMPTFQGILKDKQVDALIAYIKSLQ